MTIKDIKNLPPNKPIILKNTTCPYCGVGITEQNDSKEHVIGRRFVPKGSLNGLWNLIVRACQSCNSRKADLENDISAITLASSSWFGVEHENNITQEINRKVKNSISRKTKKPISESQENIKIQAAIIPGLNLTFNMIAPPQITEDRLYELARLQLMAFFYFITYDSDSRKGGFWTDGFSPISCAHAKDWGNSLQKSFMIAVEIWEPRWIGNTANGFHRSIIRRHPNAECWSWAIEWNKNYRLIGFFGNNEAAQEIFNELDQPTMHHIINTGEQIKIRQDVELEKNEDFMFTWNGGNHN